MVWSMGWHLVPFPHDWKMCLDVDKDCRAKVPLTSPEGTLTLCGDPLWEDKKGTWVISQNTNAIPNRAVMILRLGIKSCTKDWPKGAWSKPWTKFSPRNLWWVSIKLISPDNSSGLPLIQFATFPVRQTPRTGLPWSGLFHMCASVLIREAESTLHDFVLDTKNQLFNLLLI